MRHLSLTALLLALPTFSLAEPACFLGEHEGIPDADARTVAMLTCDALTAAGRPIVATPNTPAEGPAFRVTLHVLGESRILRVTQEEPVGKPVLSRQIRLKSLEEVESLAPRLVSSVLGQKPAEETASVDTLGAEETRAYQKKHGEMMVGLGVFGSSFINTDVTAGIGIDLAVQYETPEMAVLGELRFSGGEKDQEEVSLVQVSVGARKFFGQGNTALYAGGGLAADWMSVQRDISDWEGESTSLFGSYGEVGVETLRFHRARLSLGLRADLPFDSVVVDKQSSDVDYDEAGHEEETRYVVPISLGLTYVSTW